ncbi:MAG: ABC transporter permease [Planctomycetes bacterium]|nr:ABC transporter permease [Planctomycetota bacterium]
MAKFSSPAGPRARSRFLSASVPWLRAIAARAFGNLGWPILLKELRADFRKNRFFISHFICLAAIAFGILFKIWNGRESQLTSVQLGRDVFDLFFIIQYMIVLIVFPAFSATAFSEERVNRSLDLLITTDLQAVEIVWGKFLATSIYCLISVVATIPLLAVSTLLGGVKLIEILAAYGFLIGLTVIIAMIGVYFSSWFQANIRSTLAVYTVVLAFSGYSFYEYGELDKLAKQSEGSTLIGQIIEKYSYQPVETGKAVLEANSFEKFWSLGGFFIMGGFLFAYLFLLAANRIRPFLANRSTSLRILTLLFLVFYLVRQAVEFPWFVHLAREEHVLGMVAVAALILFLAALAYPTETPALSRPGGGGSRVRLLALFQYPFAPGASSGLVYVLLLTAAASMILAAVCRAAAGSGIPGEALARVRETLLTLPFYVFAFSTLGFFLSGCGFTPRYSVLTVFFIFVITALLPMIFHFFNWKDGIFSFYYLSPITLWWSLAGADMRPEEGPKFLLFGAPIIHVAKAVYGFLGFFFTAWGIYAGRRAVN